MYRFCPSSSNVQDRCLSNCVLELQRTKLWPLQPEFFGVSKYQKGKNQQYLINQPKREPFHHHNRQLEYRLAKHFPGQHMDLCKKKTEQCSVKCSVKCSVCLT